MFYDITRPLEDGMQVYSGHERYVIETMQTVEADGCRLSRFSMGAHCGTHMDSPAHFVEGGATMDAVPLNLLTGRALVATLAKEGISRVPVGTSRLILRDLAGGLRLETAKILVEKGVRLIGTTAMSVAPADDEARVHRAFLERGCWILENVCLDSVADGWYDLICLPMRLKGAEGAPARAILRG